MISSLEKTNLLAPGNEHAPRPWTIPDARTLLSRARRWSVPLRASSERTPGLTLELTDRTIRVRGPKVLEFVLSSRTQFPVNRLMQAIRWSPQRLERASKGIRITERRLAEILTATVREPERMDEHLQGIELKAFSKDHQWRDIMECVLRLAPEFEPYKRVALVKYMQYLRSRQAALKGIFVDRTSEVPGASVHATPLRSASEIADQLEATGARDLHELARGTDRDGLLATLPKGETLCIRLEGRTGIALALAGNPFRLEAGRRYTLVDDGGHRLPLKTGRNIVGRHPGCDVQVDPACRSVSRQHLVIEPVSEGMVLITDVSAHGTQVPASLI